MACARAIIISRGRIVADGAIDEIRAKSGKVRRYTISIQESAGDQPYRGTGQLPKQAEVESVLSGLKGAKKVTELPTDERAHTYELTSEQSVDLRPELFKLVVEKGWVLLELHRDTQKLEDVFRDLTIGDERRNRNVGGKASARAVEAEEEEEDDEEDDEDEDDDEESN
jgi:ABC-2 type transport system ATP-binding protein